MKGIAWGWWFWVGVVCGAGCGGGTAPPAPRPVPPSRPRTVVVQTRSESRPLVRRSDTATPSSSPSPSVSPTPPAHPTVIRLPGPEQAKGLALSGPDDPTSAASWRQYADGCVKARAFAEASRAYAREAAIYRKKGDPQAAVVEGMKSARYGTQIELYYWRPSRDPDRPLARLEPASGCMVGAFIDRDDKLESHMFGPQKHGDISQFNQLLGKNHASFFTYLSFQRDFPLEWAAYVREHGAIPQLAWEPKSLAEVTDQALERFVSALKAYGGPVMLRFAGEMNGEWTRYHGDPQAYRQTFRRVHQALREVPQAALLWCPNAMPADKIDSYYPGDDACDWVGVNFYSVMFLDNDPQRPGDWIHPVDLLEPVYGRYANRKPIAIGEYAASHQAVIHPTARLDFARIKMAQLYQSLPLHYAGVKLVSWYDCNNLTQARAERQLNNFQLTDQPEIVEAYKSWVAHPWFLAAGQSSAPRQALSFPTSLPGSVVVEPWVRSYDPNPQAFLRLDGKLLGVHQLPAGGSFRLPALKEGRHKLEVLVYDAAGRFVDKRVYPFSLD